MNRVLVVLLAGALVACSADGLGEPTDDDLGRSEEELTAQMCDDHIAEFGRLWERCVPTGDGDPTTPGDVPIPVSPASCQAFDWFQEYKDPATGIHYPNDNGSTAPWHDRVCFGNAPKIDEWLGKYPDSCNRLSMKFADPGTTWDASDRPDPTTGLVPGGAKGKWYSSCRNELFVGCVMAGYIGRGDALWTRGVRQEPGEHPVVVTLRDPVTGAVTKSFATAHELCQWRKFSATHRFPRKSRKSDLEPIYWTPH